MVNTKKNVFTVLLVTDKTDLHINITIQKIITYLCKK